MQAHVDARGPTDVSINCTVASCGVAEAFEARLFLLVSEVPLPEGP